MKNIDIATINKCLFFFFFFLMESLFIVIYIRKKHSVLLGLRVRLASFFFNNLVADLIPTTSNNLQIINLSIPNNRVGVATW